MNVTDPGNLRIHDNMNPQVVCLSWCKVTLVAFVWFFSTVFSSVCSECLHHRMKRHTAHINLTFSTVCFQMSPQLAYLSECKITLVTFLLLFFHCAFLNVSSNEWPERMHYHIDCIWAKISKTSVTDAAFAQKKMPPIRFLRIVMLWTCFPSIYDMSTMLNLC